MKRKEKAERIQSMLEELYPETPVPLDHNSPFQLLVAVLMSAQTTDLKVNQVTPALFKQGPTPEKMAQLEVATIQSLIREVGLAPTKAKNIRRLSELLIERHQGNIPNTFEELEALPGVGHKTAGVVLAQAFNIPAFPVDTHIHRLAARWGLSNGKNVDQTEKTSKRSFQKMHGIISIYKSSFSDENIVLHDSMICPSVQSVHGLQQRNESMKKRK